jgi:hypothetical protein
MSSIRKAAHQTSLCSFSVVPLDARRFPPVVALGRRAERIDLMGIGGGSLAIRIVMCPGMS